MLYSVSQGTYIDKIPHKSDYDRWRKNLSDNDLDIITQELNNKINNDEIHTSSWIPGSNWMGTVFEPLYWACNQNEKAAARFFGLILFKVIMERKYDTWAFGRYEKDGVPIEGLTYFKLKNPVNP
ncbi:hypothetical protein ABEX78_32935 [Priestia megaterium]